MPFDRPRILVIDDEQDLLHFMERALSGMGYEAGIARFGEGGFDLALVDLQMPDLNGIEVIRQMRAQDGDAVAIIITGYGSIESAVEAVKAGAVDYLTKPVDLDHLEIVVGRALEGKRQAEKLQMLEEQVARQGSFEGLVGVSPEMQGVYRLIRQVANSEVTVLIQGETGTGKEGVARAIHSRSRRKGFVPINCGALPETILESELFGHEEGAFTGAVKRKYGLIEQAGGGTLFLDEIEEMSPALQVKLLRAIQEREVLRVGGDQPIPVDFRLIAAAGEDLRGQMEAGAFRADLFYRLSVMVIDLPPLKARRGDIPLLAGHFVAMYAARNGQPTPEISPEAMMLLTPYAWPGNVRELENAIEQAILLSEGQTISMEHLPEHVIAAPVSDGRGADFCDLPLREARERFERGYLEEMLARAGGNVAEAARRAGINRQYFYEKMRRCRVSREDGRG